jgi:hypothetical protein
LAPFHVAAKQGYVHLIDTLFAAGADIHIKDHGVLHHYAVPPY